MEVYIIGSLIKEFRTRLKISQEELSFGLCAVSTLSRIENGSQIPGRKLAEALFSKMGLNAPVSSIPMSKLDYARSQLELEINRKIATKDYNVKDLLEEYINSGNEFDIFEKQFYIFYKSLSEDILNHNSSFTIKQFEKALQLTISDYKIGMIPESRLLTKTELLILNNISRMQYFTGQKEDAIKLMEFLKGYFENGIVNDEEKAKNYPIILLNLENWYGLEGKPEKVLELTDIGIKTCIKYGKLSPFPYHIFNKGYAYALSGEKEKAKKCMSDAFIFFENMNQHEDAVFGKKKVNELFGFDFPEV